MTRSITHTTRRRRQRVVARSQISRADRTALAAGAAVLRFLVSFGLATLTNPAFAQDDDDLELAADAQPTADAQPVAAAARWTASLAVAAGATERTIDFTAEDGPRRLDTGWVPALGVELAARFERERVQLEASATYQTSYHATGIQRGLDPQVQPAETPLRTHRLELGVTPTLRFGEAADSVSAGAFVGYALRAVGSVAELRVPRSTLHGPRLRLELNVPFARGALRLRVATEADLIVSITRGLRNLGRSEALGFALGLEGSVVVRVLSWLDAALIVRESHASVSSNAGSSLTDRERFALLQAELQL